MGERRKPQNRSYWDFARRHTGSTIMTNAVGAAFASIHRAAEKGSSRKLSRPIYALSCMSIRLALQAVANPSERSIDLLDWEGKTLQKMGTGRLK